MAVLQMEQIRAARTVKSVKKGYENHTESSSRHVFEDARENECCAQQTGMHILVVEAPLIAIYST
jgi:hypothetical protein